MKLLTSTFLTCAVKTCRASPASYPMHFRDATLARSEVAYNPLLLRNLLPRLNLDALEMIVGELGLRGMMPERGVLEFIAEGTGGSRVGGGGGEREGGSNTEEGGLEDGENERDAEIMLEGHAAAVETKEGETSEGVDDEEAVLKKLHTLLIETSVQDGKLVCGNCGFEYPIKEGVGNFLLPGHLV